MIKRLRSLLDPCFVFRPDVFVRACFRKLRPRPAFAVVRTAWGDDIGIDPRMFIGAYLYMRAAHELAVCEVLARLTAPSDHALDIGANIGTMTSVLSRRVGTAGSVTCIEAHPRIFQQLKANVERWPGRAIHLVHGAVSNCSGTVWLNEGAATNEGTARILGQDSAGSCPVPAFTLDERFSGQSFGVWKIDVEGHELAVLQGARQLLKGRRVRDIVFESSRVFPSPVHQLLLDAGYAVFAIEHSLTGLRLVEPTSHSTTDESLGDFLATQNPARSLKLCQPSGWTTLQHLS